VLCMCGCGWVGGVECAFASVSEATNSLPKETAQAVTQNRSKLREPRATQALRNSHSSDKALPAPLSPHRTRNSLQRHSKPLKGCGGQRIRLLLLCTRSPRRRWKSHDGSGRSAPGPRRALALFTRLPVQNCCSNVS
jgi:hypothetical protein